MTKELSLSRGRRLRATTVYDTYWKFAHARQKAFMQRVAGAPPPWTDDPIIAEHRFTNAYRASDRVSQYLIRHVIYEGSQDPEELFFRILLFKFFNRIETWEMLVRAFGQPDWRSFKLAQYDEVLTRAIDAGETLYTAAYMMPTPKLGAMRKHSNHLMLLDWMMKRGAPEKVANARSLEEVFQTLRAYPSVGDFLAFQYAIDLNYSTIINFSEMDFVVAGPGACDGIRKCFEFTTLTAAEIIHAVTERASIEFDRLELDFPKLWGRHLQLIDCQNLFCETDKYSRVAHPEVVSRRAKIKQKFRPVDRPVPQWYPPKWGLEVKA